MGLTANPGSRLEDILAHTRAVVAERKHASNMAELERAAAEHVPRGFVGRLQAMAVERPAIIAELKRASPSKGVLRESLDVPRLAAGFEAAGAAALSVLTEEKYFLGSLANLEAASHACALPCLRKDFTVDEFQLLEARAHRADAVLLLAAALDDDELSELAVAADELGLDVLCEVHTAGELDRVLALTLDPNRVALGINSRDLHSFAVSLDAMVALASNVPEDAGFVLVAESGIGSAEDIVRLRDAGFGAFLIGETLMRAPEPAEALRELFAACG